MAAAAQLRSERGQILPFLALGVLSVLLGIAALVIDVGSWYQAKRQLQSVADAAALAAVQELPAADPTQAAAVARRFAVANGVALREAPRFTTSELPNDTVEVVAEENHPAFFARVFGLDSVTIRRRAVARAVPVAKAALVVPIAVSASHPVLVCGAACFGRTVTLTYESGAVGAPGAFGFVDLANTQGSVSEPALAEWVRRGYPAPVPARDYESVPGNRFNGRPVRHALDELVAARRPVLLPVYSRVGGEGENATYTVVGFAGFSLSAWDPYAGGSTTTITGVFRSLVTRGVGAPGTPYFGAKTVRLVA